MTDVQDPTRLAALASYDILDSLPEEGFDDVVQLARELCDAPVALVSLVAADRQWFKARVGFPLCETALDASVCAHALAEPDLLVITDLTLDPRTRSNPLVAGDPFIRFYAGAPLRTEGGDVLGTLCVIDTESRPTALTEAQADGLKRLARQVVNLLELRKAVKQREAALSRQHLAGEALEATEAKLRESEDHFRHTVELNPVVPWTCDPQGNITSYSKRWLDLTGQAPGEPDGAGWIGALHPDDVERTIETFSACLASGNPIDVDYRLRVVATGGYRWMRARAYPRRNSDDVITRWYGVVEDVHDRRVAEERLRVSDALARENSERVRLALAAGAIIGTWHWDLPTDRFTVDDAFADAFGLDPALGRDGIPLAQIVATVHPDDQAGLAFAIREAIARGGAYAHQYRVLRADGRYYWLEANGRVDHAPDGTPLSFPGVLLDIEKRRAVEQERDRAATSLRALNETLEQRVTERTAELMRAEEQLRQAQKMEAVGQLTGGLAHDFNNLLTGIIGALDLINKRLAQGRIADIGRYLDMAASSASRAAALTHRLLAFSRRQTLDPKATDVDRLVSGMVDMIRRTVGPSIGIHVVTGPGTWAALVDPSQLENALLNLCINARDAMPDGGQITVEIENCWIENRAAIARDFEAGPYLKLSVSDTGIGMPPDVIARAFDPFFTTKPLGQGTGLGLSMIYGFAKQSGGQVRIHSQPGQGTTVALYLPRHDGGTTEHIAPTEDIAAMPRAERGEIVLVVDDEPAVRMLIADVLSDLGYTSVEAADGAAGLKILRSDIRVDLLITDVGLPGGMNGRQVADAARVLRPDLKVLFITGYAESIVMGNGNLDTGMAVLTKPFAMDDLAAKVRALIEE